ncbi:MAG TPA: SDR family NAD(P)-dependent oxidoreductase [Candidatus Thermoplasmatota archaeon]|nr:SDR family NAD(P)-dependent oxidoreductase [Candidatus Thermoplasmatota archaeon]
MKTSGNTVLITGGGTGIGFALAEALVKADNEVIICGRREAKLKEAKKQLPQLHFKICDVADERQRRALVSWMSKNFTGMNVLINNAGIQRMTDFTSGRSNRNVGGDEVDINLKAPVALCELFIPMLMKHKQSAIVNVSSGLGFCPIAVMPVYCATKAALHSFTVSLRFQLRNTSVKVFEIIPPMVDTELDKGGRDERDQEERGIPPSEVAVAAMKGFARDEFEIAVGEAQGIKKGALKNPEELFRHLNEW